MPDVATAKEAKKFHEDVPAETPDLFLNCASFLDRGMKNGLSRIFNPPWSGQKFADSAVLSLGRVRQMIRDSGQDILLVVDGCVTRDNIAAVAAMRVDIIITGSAVFDGKALRENATFMLATVAEVDKRLERPAKDTHC